MTVLVLITDSRKEKKKSQFRDRKAEEVWSCWVAAAAYQENLLGRTLALQSTGLRRGNSSEMGPRSEGWLVPTATWPPLIWHKGAAPSGVSWSGLCDNWDKHSWTETGNISFLSAAPGDYWRPWSRARILREKPIPPLRWGLPRWHRGKESACQCRRPGFDPWIGKIPCGGKWPPPQYSCHLENSMDRGAWRATVHGVTKSRTRLSTRLPPHLNRDEWIVTGFPNSSSLKLGWNGFSPTMFSKASKK